LDFERPTKQRMSQPAWILGWSIEQVAATRSTRLLFEELTEEYQLNSSHLFNNWQSAQKAQNTGGLYAGDFNRDGCTDLLITDINPSGNSLLKGLPDGGFEDVTAELNLLAIRKSYPEAGTSFAGLYALLCDLNSDGWEDLVFANGQVWQNIEGRRFLNVTIYSNLRRFSGSLSTCLSTADFDRDGKMDLYVCRPGGRPNSWLQDTKDAPERNILLRNLGDWQFEDATARSGADGGARSTFTALWFDANNDLWPDLYVINEFGDGALYVNQTDGTFRPMDTGERTDDFGSMGATCGDIDNDGNIDLYLAGMYSKAGSRVVGNLPVGVYPDDIMRKLRRLISGSEFYQNDGGLKFTALGEAYQLHDVGWAWGPTMADFNNDGWLDIFATAGYMSRDRSKPDG
jgi:hypothetical protein